ncbi:hypothetical protein BDZ97DRAFT_1906778 [Flammula alnicola]|nr:hypothetical protein BDZ97DRAFT_1906778 [Flammula alnicola]
MAYVQVEADDQRLEEGPEGLQFKSNQRKGGGSFWTIEYYQPYFDVDTQTVLKRCYTTLIPTEARTYISTHLNPPDLYGPFWTLSTLIFALYLSSSLGASIAKYLSTEDTPYDYDFRLLSIAVTIVYAYGLALPVLCVIPVPIVRWVLVGLAFGLSGWFLGSNIYPILASAEAKAMRLLIVVLAAIHLGIAISFKVLFFSYYVVDKIGADITLPGGDAGTGNSTVPRWI